jgi:hypothetical protein
VVVLLCGVLCLSWRLHDDSTTQPAKSATSLTPSFGFADTDSENQSDPRDQDEPYNDEAEPFYRKKEDTHTASTRNRRRTMSQAEEIWGELQDNDGLVHPHINMVNEGEYVEDANERTDLLRKPLGRRKISYGFPRVATVPSTRRILKRPLPQEATGGWWKLTWWKRMGARRHDTSTWRGDGIA